MKQPERLLNSGSPRARELLASLAEDVPPDPTGGAERVLRALDVPPGLAPRPSRPKGLAFRRYVPLAAIVSVIGLTTFSALVVVDSRAPKSTSVVHPVDTAPNQAPIQVPIQVTGEATPSPGPNAVAEPTAVSAPSVDVHALASAPSPAVTVDPGAVRPAPLPPRTARNVPTTATHEPAPARETADELQLLEHAQAAAARGRADEALALVAEHRREFPRGSFLVEMSVIEVEALARQGRIDEAAARGERLLESHPASPYARRVEAVIRLRDRKDMPR
ncbi:hypothetical protein AKJ09_07772 [Labilithrix luteola]|uniref:Uncharacterized protein n=1 Tax=Labilithrix luteola TaxID=1391654 RepID=A0A0K1Q5V2_9BACT|nr:hypothetical protein [Labilithrix luteola]AKV01109.1 hypothetical protein AKJ09_07772 [Labilithrix luteola]